ncbi:hypothetical protein [Gorillibacterium sp. CAU 1737]|uniref:hypothetical protein n=1 Tax=Gorillibacterium sp. CAU 1737 TaxID=3140362 RepID=UPI00325FE0DC
MAVYDQSVRKLMTEAGYDNSKIGHDAKSGYVTYDGNPFMKAQKFYQNTNYTDAQSFKNANSQFTTKYPNYATGTTKTGYLQQQPTAQTTQTNQYGGTYGTSYVNPQDEQINNLIASLTQMAQTPSNYNPYSSPEYAAYQAQANQGAQNSIRAGQEALGTSGMARSTDMVNWAQGAQNDANQYLQTQVIPQLIAQNREQEQQKYANLMALLNPLQSQQGVFDTRNQNAIENRRADKSDNWGAYLDIVDRSGNFGKGPSDNWGQLLTRSQDPNAPLTLAGQQQGFNQNMDIAGLTGNYNGQRTLAGQQFDRGVLESDRNFNYQAGRDKVSDNFEMASLTGYINGKPTTAEQQRVLSNLWNTAGQLGTVPDALADMIGVPRGTQTQDAMRLQLQQAGVDLDILKYGSSSGTASGPSVSDIASNISRSISGMGDSFNIATPEGKKQIETIIVSQANDPVTAVQLYNMYGIPVPADLQAEYAAAKKANP